MAGSQGIRAGAAFVELFADDSKLVRGLKHAQGEFRKFGRSVETIGAGLKTAGTWLTGIGAAVVAPLTVAAKTFGDMGHNLVEMSRRTGMSVEALSELSFAATQSGASLETLETGVRRMQRVIGAAAGGSKAAADALAKLGLSAHGLLALTPEQQFSAVADSLAKITDPTLRAAAAMTIFGRSGTELLPLAARGAAGLAQMRAEAQALGLTISTDDAQAGMKFHETLNLVWASLKRVAFEVGAAVAPALQEAARWLIDMARAAGQWTKEHQGLVVLALKVGAVVAVAGGAVLALGTVISTVGGVFTTLASVLSVAGTLLPMIGAAIGAILTPMGAAVAAVVALGAALVGLAGYGLYASGALGRAWAWLMEKTRVLREDFMATLSGIADALASGDIALAARILWLTLRMEWQRGVSYLTGIWIEWKAGFLDLFTDAFYGWKMLWSAACGWVTSIWTEAVAGWQMIWEKFVEGVSLGWNWIKEKAGAITPEEAEANRREITGQADQRIAELRAAGEAKLASIEAEKQAAITEAHDAGMAAREAHRKNASDTLAAAQKDLADARKDWQDALDRAHKTRASESGPGGPGAPEKPFDAFGWLGSSLADVRMKVGIAGGFNPAAAWGLTGLGSIDRVAKATEQTAKNTREIADSLDDGGMYYE